MTCWSSAATGPAPGGRGSYRIDMVVEGDADSRLAIECDGDQYHGPAQWDSDMRRQRILERAGWRFWRCFASTFVRHREDVVQDLVDTLAAHGVHPSNAQAPVRSLHVETRQVVAFPARHLQTPQRQRRKAGKPRRHGRVPRSRRPRRKGSWRWRSDPFAREGRTINSPTMLMTQC